MIIPHGPVEPSLLDAVNPGVLAEALELEGSLLSELAAVLRRQREGVASDDVSAVDDSVVAAHRVMRTLDQARERRRLLVGILAAAEDTPLEELEAALGARMTPRLASARGRIQDEARVVAREIEVNRRVLRGVLEQGNRFLRALCGGTTTASYDPANESGYGGGLVNQHV